MTKITTVVFDVGRVLFQWDLRHLFAKLIDDENELNWFLYNVVTPEWHFQHDAGRPLAEMTAELSALLLTRYTSKHTARGLMRLSPDR